MWRYELCQVFRQVEARERGKKLLQRRGRRLACGGMSCVRFLGKWRQEREGKSYCKEGEEKSSSPTFVCLQEEDDKQCHQNNTVCIFFFIVYETVSFCIKRVISFKRKWRQNMSHSKSILNLWFIQSSSQLQFYFQESIQLHLCQIQMSALKLAAFFILVLRLGYMQFNP